MKRIIPIILSLLFLAGCNVNADYIEPEDRVIVSALGFQSTANDIMLTLETIDVSTTSNEDSYSTLIITGTGKTVYEAVADAESKAYGEILFSQCPVILLGTDINPEQLNGILDYCVDSDNISLAVKLLTADNPYSVLNNNNSKKALGYQIMNMIEYGNEVSGVTKYDTFVTITNVRENDNYAYRIPYLTMSDGLNIGGTAIYQNDGLIFIADLPDSQLLQMLCSELKKCTLVNENSVLNIKSTHTNIETDNQSIKVNIEITAEDFKGLYNLPEFQEKLNNKLNYLVNGHFDVVLQLLKQNHRKISTENISEISTEISVSEEL